MVISVRRHFSARNSCVQRRAYRCWLRLSERRTQRRNVRVRALCCPRLARNSQNVSTAAATLAWSTTRLAIAMFGDTLNSPRSILVRAGCGLCTTHLSQAARAARYAATSATPHLARCMSDSVRSELVQFVCTHVLGD